MTTVFEVIDMALAEYYCSQKEYEKGLGEYRKLIGIYEGEQKQRAIGELIKYSFEYAAQLAQENRWGEAISIYREVMTYPNPPVTIYKNIGLCFKAMERPTESLTFLEKYREETPNNPEAYQYLGEVEYTAFREFKKAIEYYEKALELGAKTFHVYSMLGHLYSTFYRDRYEDKQIEYLTRAYELEPKNRIAVKNLAYVLGKFNRKEADKYYAELLKVEPQHSDLHSYGAYLVRQKRFKEGFTYLRHRFQKEDLKGAFFPAVFQDKEYGWTPEKSIKNKNVIIYYEQGFGDTIMFARFIEQVKGMCKSLAVIVQPALLDLFTDSDLGVPFCIPQQLDNLAYDIVVPMMDLPLICNTTPETIPFAEGFLKVPKSKIEKYRKEYIGDNKTFKIGIAYEGTLSSKETQRDIELSRLYPLMQLPNVTVYSFQVDDLTKQMDKVPEEYNFVRLGHTFKNWEDTACAMNCMDLIVTTDNGVMNLAGALGMKTFGLFNSITEWRWFKTTGEDIAWYKSIKPFQCSIDGAWDVVVEQVVSEVQRLAKEKK